MEMSTIFAIVSAFFALISILVSWRSYYINTTDRRIKENPFFIVELKSFTSNYPIGKGINQLAYNFIKASNDKKRLDELKKESFSKYKKDVHLSITDKTYMKLYNAGGIGKNLKIEAHVVVPEHQLEKGEYNIKDWKVEFEGENEDELGDYSIFITHKNKEDMRRLYFNSHIVVESNSKGVNSDGYLKVWVPNEFILFTNLFIAKLVDDPPYIKFNIEGENIYGAKFRDELTLIIERYKTVDSSNDYMISVDISGV